MTDIKEAYYMVKKDQKITATLYLKDSRMIEANREKAAEAGCTLQKIDWDLWDQIVQMYPLKTDDRIYEKRDDYIPVLDNALEDL